jgi:hypothetical protein
MNGTQKLGFVTCQSGVLIVIDTGYLGIWSHDRPPVLQEGVLGSDEATERANRFVDLRIVGADAEQAGRLLGMSWHPLFIYDQPVEHPELRQKLGELTRAHRLDAGFEVISPRVPHRRRVDLALQQGNGAGEILFHGIWASVIGDIPTAVPLPIMGKRCSGPNNDRWERVSIECRPQLEVARSEMVGSVGVDYARLLVADVDALGSWKHEESLDGLADYIFWGRDAEKAAQALGAPRVEPEDFGWIDVPEDFAQEHRLKVEEYKEERSLKFATDYRPHSHHWRVMKPTRESSTESGTTEVGGVTVCNFMTAWGDGLFEVYRELGEGGELVRVRIELAPKSDPNA